MLMCSQSRIKSCWQRKVRDAFQPNPCPRNVRDRLCEGYLIPSTLPDELGFRSVDKVELIFLEMNLEIVVRKPISTEGSTNSRTATIPTREPCISLHLSPHSDMCLQTSKTFATYVPAFEMDMLAFRPNAIKNFLIILVQPH